MSADDEIWLDALAGRNTESSATAREAKALRAALRERPVENLTALPDKTREDALIARAVNEGLIAAPARAKQWTRWQLPIAASVLLVVAAGVLVQLQPRPPVMRGDADNIAHLVSADPAGLKQQILEQLRAAGVDATGYEALGVHGVDADLILPLSPEVKRVLAKYSIAEPEGGVLRVEIRSSR